MAKSLTDQKPSKANDTGYGGVIVLGIVLSVISGLILQSAADSSDIAIALLFGVPGALLLQAGIIAWGVDMGTAKIRDEFGAIVREQQRSPGSAHLPSGRSSGAS